MPFQANQRLPSLLRSISEALCIFVFLIGLLALTGWKFDIVSFKSILPSLPVMAPNTAFALIITSVSLWLLQEKRTGKSARNVGYTLAFIIAAIGLATITEYLLNLSFGVDNILFRNALGPTGNPVRMSPQSAINFLIISVSLFLINTETKTKKIPSQFLIFIVGFISLLSLFGFIHNVPGFYTISPYKGMAAHTAVAFISIFIAIFISRPEKGLMRVFTNRGIGGIASHRLLFALIFLSVTDILVMVGQQKGLYSAAQGSAIHIILITGVFIYLMFISFESLDRIEIIETEREKLKRQTKELGNFKLAFESASDHITITDADGKILYANKAAEITTGYGVNEIIGKTPSLWGRQMPQEFYKKLWQTIKTDKATFAGEVTNKRKNGEIYEAEIHISPIIDENKKIRFFVSIERDITKAKEIDRAKTEFVSMAAHQLRTPLTSIKWFTNALLENIADKPTEKQKEYLEGIYASTNKMIDLVNVFLDVSRIELGTFTFDPKLVDIASVAEEVLKEESEQLISKQIAVEKEFEPNLPEIFIEPKIVRITMQNLISNAIKYTPEGGKININISKTNGGALIKVEDNGCGIPSGQQAKIFTKLFRASNARNRKTVGTGLGLYIVKSLIERNSGKIWFESEENKGSIFFVSIPQRPI